MINLINFTKLEISHTIQLQSSLSNTFRVGSAFPDTMCYHIRLYELSFPQG